MVFQFLQKLFDTSGFPARWHCGNWTAFHGYLHIVSDLLVWGAYTAIPCVLAFYVWRRKDVTFPRLFWLFCAFIFACGTTHLIEATIFYYPIYRIGAVFKLITAVVSWATVIALVRVAPHALRLPSLGRLNDDLRHENEIRRRYELELRLSEQRYRSLAEMIASIIWQTDAEGGFWHALPDWTAFTGQDFYSYHGLGWLDAIHEEERDAVREQWIEATRSGQPFDVEARLWHQPTESYRHVQLKATPIQDDEQRITGYVGLVNDDHDRWLADQRFRQALEAAPSAMIMFDSRGRLVLANRQAEELFGYTRDEFRSIHVSDLIPEEYRQGHEGMRTEFMHAPVAREMGKGRELYSLRKDGSRVPVEIGLTPIQTTEGHMVVSSIVDISDRKKSSEELEKRAEELYRSNRDLEHFASIVSHDLREPLRMITSFTELLRRKIEPQLDEKTLDWMRYITEGATRMDRLITDLLAYSRVKTKTMNLRPVKLKDIIQRAMDNLHDAIADDHAEIVLRELPEVHVDSTLFTQVFQNLIANAIRFRSEAPPRIEISATQEAECWHIQVRDNGIGMESRDLDKIFIIFQRLHSRKKYDGTGIGLAICKRIIDLHGGKIWVESSLGEGAVFHFTILESIGGKRIQP